MKKLTFLALVSLAALAAFALIGTRTHRPAPSLPAVVEPVGTPVSLAPPASPAPVDPMKSYRWVVGDHGVWALQTSLRLGAVEDEQAAQLTSVSGTLELTVLAAASEEVRLLAMLHEPQCQSAGVAMPALAGSPESAMIGVGLILAACGKSAQVPVGGWLPLPPFWLPWP